MDIHILNIILYDPFLHLIHQTANLVETDLGLIHHSLPRVRSVLGIEENIQ